MPTTKKELIEQIIKNNGKQQDTLRIGHINLLQNNFWKLV